jgi:hypothetical protein
MQGLAKPTWAPDDRVMAALNLVTMAPLGVAAHMMYKNGGGRHTHTPTNKLTDDSHFRVRRARGEIGNGLVCCNGWRDAAYYSGRTKARLAIGMCVSVCMYTKSLSDILRGFGRFDNVDSNDMSVSSCR